MERTQEQITMEGTTVENLENQGDALQASQVLENKTVQAPVAKENPAVVEEKKLGWFNKLKEAVRTKTPEEKEAARIKKEEENRLELVQEYATGKLKKFYDDMRGENPDKAQKWLLARKNLGLNLTWNEARNDWVSTKENETDAEKAARRLTEPKNAKVYSELLKTDAEKAAKFKEAVKKYQNFEWDSETNDYKDTTPYENQFAGGGVGKSTGVGRV